MYSITKWGRFEASHILVGHSGKCGRLHGHSYRFEVTLVGDSLDSIGLLIDFSELPIREIEHAYDHQHLNTIDHPMLKLEKTSAEYIAVTIYRFVENWLLEEKGLFRVSEGAVHVQSVTVWETAKCKATYHEYK